MRIALLTVGSRGDVQPMVAVAEELSRRGHAVTLLVNLNFLPWIGERSFEVLGAPVDSEEYLRSPSGQATLASGRIKDLFDELNRIQWEANDATMEVFIRAVEGAELILSSALTFFRGVVLAERFKLPHIPLFLAPTVPTRAFPHFALPLSTLGLGVLNRWSYDFVLKQIWSGTAPTINALRTALDLEPLSAPPDQNQFQRSVGLFSDVLVPRPRDWATGHQIAGFANLKSEDRAAMGELNLPADVEAWLSAGEAPLFFGFGSMPLFKPQEFLGEVVRLCEHLDARALVGSGWTDYGPSPSERVFIADAIDHEQVLPRCRVAVHHGGAGTTHTALGAGLPSLVGSFFVDQPFWGRAVKRLGVGDTLPFKKLDFAAMARLLPPLLRNETKKRAEELGARVRQEDGAGRAADIIEAEFRS